MEHSALPTDCGRGAMQVSQSRLGPGPLVLHRQQAPLPKHALMLVRASDLYPSISDRPSGVRAPKDDDLDWWRYSRCARGGRFCMTQHIQDNGQISGIRVIVAAPTTKFIGIPIRRKSVKRYPPAE